MKTIYCDSGYTWCKKEVSDNYKEACKKLNSIGWKKIGYRLQWGWYCSFHIPTLKNNEK